MLPARPAAACQCTELPEYYDREDSAKVSPADGADFVPTDANIFVSAAAAEGPMFLIGDGEAERLAPTGREIGHDHLGLFLVEYAPATPLGQFTDYVVVSELYGSLSRFSTGISPTESPPGPPELVEHSLRDRYRGPANPICTCRGYERADFTVAGDAPWIFLAEARGMGDLFDPEPGDPSVLWGGPEGTATSWDRLDAVRFIAMDHTGRLSDWTDNVELDWSEASCACAAAPPPGAGPWLLLPLLWIRRRERA